MSINTQAQQEHQEDEDQQRAPSVQEITSVSTKALRKKPVFSKKLVDYKPFQILMEITPRSMLYLHGDFILCFYQLQNENMCRKFHHNNMFRQINQIRIWKPQNQLILPDTPQSTFVEALIEKSYFSKQDFLGIAENFVYHGSKETEFYFGQALMQWHQQGQRYIKALSSQNELLVQMNLFEQYQDQEIQYKSDLLEIIYKKIEQESVNGDFFQYNINELNRKTNQYENTRVGISKGLSCLLGADENGSQQIMIRNGTFEYLDNRTNLRILRKQLLQCSNAQGQTSNNNNNNNGMNQNTQQPNFYDVFIEEQAVLHTLDDFTIPCRVIQYNIQIQHNLYEKYPQVYQMWCQLGQTLGYQPYPDLVNVEVRFVEVEAYALDSLLQLRLKSLNVGETQNISQLVDELGYSIRSIYFIEKFYENNLEKKKKRYRRKKGHINDWEYLQHKYDEYKEQQEKKLLEQKNHQLQIEAEEEEEEGIDEEDDENNEKQLSSTTSINNNCNDFFKKQQDNYLNNHSNQPSHFPNQQLNSHNQSSVNHNQNQQSSYPSLTSDYQSSSEDSHNHQFNYHNHQSNQHHHQFNSHNHQQSQSNQSSDYLNSQSNYHHQQPNYHNQQSSYHQQESNYHQQQPNNHNQSEQIQENSKNSKQCSIKNINNNYNNIEQFNQFHHQDKGGNTNQQNYVFDPNYHSKNGNQHKNNSDNIEQFNQFHHQEKGGNKNQQNYVFDPNYHSKNGNQHKNSNEEKSILNRKHYCNCNH